MIIHLLFSGINERPHCERIAVYETLRLKHTFTCIISGPTGYGKSTFCIKILQNFKALSTGPTFRVGIIWCYSEKTAIP
jgi:ABC-type lipoprotein export system ATPase subunit